MNSAQKARSGADFNVVWVYPGRFEIWAERKVFGPDIKREREGFKGSKMELVLQRFDSNQELSVGECIMKAVEGMDEEGRLDTALEVVGMGLDQEERLQEVVAET